MKNKTHAKQVSSKISAVVLVICIIFIAYCLIFVFIIPVLQDNFCRNRKYDEFDKITDISILSANICVIAEKADVVKGEVKISYSDGASGVIFRKEDNTYYALTAYHVAFSGTGNLYAADFESPVFGNLEGENRSGITEDEYYRSLPQAKAEYADKNNDIAIISFKSDRPLGVISMSDKRAALNEHIAVVSNTSGKRNHISYGDILTEETEPLQTNDYMSGTPVLRHNAFVETGSSGGAVLDRSMKIVGMNVASAKDLLGNFRYGSFVPASQLAEDVEEWETVKMQNTK